ncbi:MAG: hypothetical protein KatS3mg110_4666 [Pirellulaceae bacterium]|nr:MAG: hypothetical protein KatS3mg110_4666 [Pirellulaceae bacterium]
MPGLYTLQRLVFGGLWILCLVGCTEYYGARTILHSDGSLERTVCQPQGSLEASSDWLFFREVVAPQGESQLINLENLEELPPPSEDDNGRCYVLAHGRFANVGAIPAHVRFTSPDGSLSAGLERRYERRNFGWFVEHFWEETLTDVVTLAELRKARQELADILIDYFLAVIREAYGEAIQTAALENWLRQEVVPCCQELVDTFYEASLQPATRPMREKKLLAVLAKYGLELVPTEMDQGANQERVRNFVASKLQQLLTDAQGRPVPAETVTQILDWILPENAERSDAENESKLEQAARHYRLERYGGDEAFERKLQSLLVRIVGVHEALAPARHFVYEMQVPGVVVETSGTLVADNGVRWKFTAAEAYPVGYRMLVRSLEPCRELQQRLWGEVRFSERSDLELLWLWASADDGFKNALTASAQQGSLAPVRQWLEDANDDWQSLGWKRQLAEKILH